MFSIQAREIVERLTNRAKTHGEALYFAGRVRVECIYWDDAVHWNISGRAADETMVCRVLTHSHLNVPAWQHTGARNEA
jgi:hypothetical protein